MTDPATEREALRLFEALLDMAEPERDAWLASHVPNIPGLRTRIDAMRAADRMASFPTGGAVDTLEEEPPPERIGVYRIVGQIGRGGMGTVYRGERASGDFALSVAIKLIKPGLFSPALVERFQRERQTLASLAHPNIARLYDGGETESGSPYIVMELVDGLPLLEWAEQTQPSTKRRIGIVREICAGVGFAHSNLIVHRDLTPSNVIVTVGNVAKLIDFGIAKPADAPASVPQELSGSSLVSLSLTPGFAAPERQTSTEVTTAADIYSIGKLIERLIADSGGDAELRAIVTRATAYDPADRYPTVDALDADLAAWSAAMPVAAMGNSWRYRAGKFVRRYRFGVAALTTGLILLIGAFVVSLVAYNRALAEQTKADERFQQTRAIAKTMLFDAYDEVSKVSGATLARQTLAKTSLTYLDALASDPNAPRDVKIEAAQGYLRLARVTGDGQSGQLGKFEEANALLAKSAALLEPIHAADPRNAAIAQSYAALLVERARTNIYNNNAIPLARAQAIEAQKLLEPIARNTVETARLFAQAKQAEGDSYLWTNDYEKARTILTRVEQFIISLPNNAQQEAGITGVRSSTLRLLGEAHHKLKQTAMAREVLDRSVVLARELVTRDPTNPALARQLSVALRYAGVVHRTNYRDAEALAAIAESVEIARNLRVRDPNDAGALQLFVLTNEVYAQVLGDSGAYAKSFTAGADVFSAQQKLVQLAGDAPGALRSFAASTSTRGGNHYSGGDYVGACRWWREALDTYLALERRGALTEYDRKRGVPNLRGYLSKGCENGPPRAFAGGP